MTRYPKAEWVPWGYGPLPTYYRGQNNPEAVVLHVMQGYATTARSWASSGHFGASWHFTVARDGSVMQHLDFEDGGYHAGIPSTAPVPAWSLWKGHGVNVNNYTIGVEHEGFSGEPFPPAQAEASRELCKWLCAELSVPYDRAHLPPHADIDLINRPNDFNVPELRAAYYHFLLEDEMTPEERAKLDAVYAALTGGVDGVIEAWNANGNSVLVAYNDIVFPHINNHPADQTAGVPPHAHRTTITATTTSEVIQ